MDDGAKLSVSHARQLEPQTAIPDLGVSSYLIYPSYTTDHNTQ
jgi:hypothetical protein